MVFCDLCSTEIFESGFIVSVTWRYRHDCLVPPCPVLMARRFSIHGRTKCTCGCMCVCGSGLLCVGLLLRESDSFYYNGKI